MLGMASIGAHSLPEMIALTVQQTTAVIPKPQDGWLLEGL